MKKTLLPLLIQFLLFLVFPSVLYAQTTFQAVYGGSGSERGAALALSGSGGYLVTGKTDSWGATTNDAFVIKMNPSGQIQWLSTLGGTGQYWPKGVIELPDKSIMVAGHTDQSGYNKVIYKLDSNGSVMWYKSEGVSSRIELIRHLKMGPKGEIIAGGYSHDTWNAASDGFLTKIDTAGNTIWNWNYGNTHNDWLHDFTFTMNGGTAWVGYREAYPGDPGWEAAAYKTDSLGNINWSYKYGAPGDQRFDCVIQIADSGFMICGTTNDAGFGSGDWTITRLDKNGNVVWTKRYGGSGDERPTTIIPTSDGKFAVVGWTYSFGQGGRDFMLMKVDTAGKVLWARTYGGSGNEFTWVVQELFETSDGGFIFSGETASFGAGSTDIMVVKTDSMGETPGCDYITVTPSDTTHSLLKASHPINKLSSAGTASPILTTLLKSDTAQYLCCASPSANFNWTANCEDDTVHFQSLSQPITAVTKYEWDFDGNGSIDDTTGPNVSVILSPGTYNSKLIISDTCGSKDTIQLQVISAIANLLVSIGPDTSVCANIGYALNAGNPGLNYAWSNGSNSQSISPTNSGTYSVIVTDQNGCKAADTAVLSFLATPVFNLSAPPMCEGDTSLCVTASVPGLNYLWSNGGSGDSICPNSPGTYSATAADTATGCTHSDTVLSPLNPGPYVDLGPDTLLCPNDTICLGTGGIGSIFVWSNGDTTVTSCLDSGKHYVTVTDSFGCQRADTIVIGEMVMPITSFTIDSIECPLMTFQNTSPAQSIVTFSWDFGDGSTDTSLNPQHNYMAAGNGNYTILLIGTNGCGSDTTSLQILIDCITYRSSEIESQFVVYPNPVEDILNITSSSVGPYQVEFIDVLGRRISVKLVSNDLGKRTFDVSKLNDGIYLLKFVIGENVFTRRIEIRRI